MALLNTFDLAEGSINESNYDVELQRLNGTSPDIIQGLQLRGCDIQTFLSEVRYGNAYVIHMYKPGPSLFSIQVDASFTPIPMALLLPAM